MDPTDSLRDPTAAVDTEAPQEQSCTIDSVNYLVTGRTKRALDSVLVNWEVFQEVYKNEELNNTLFNQILEMIHMNPDHVPIQETTLEMVKKIHALPDKSHIVSMFQQFMVYEPLSIAIYGVFLIYKTHFENQIRLYVDVRNNWITKNFAGIATNPAGIANDLQSLLVTWSDLCIQHSIDTSSLILYFVNPPIESINRDATESILAEKNGLIPKGIGLIDTGEDDDSHRESDVIVVDVNQQMDSLETEVATTTSHFDLRMDEDQLLRIPVGDPPIPETEILARALSTWHYRGFCPKVPHERLLALLSFPIHELHDAIRALKPDHTPPDYAEIDNRMHEAFTAIGKFPEIDNPIDPARNPSAQARRTPPTGLDDNALIIWYVTDILEIRKSLMSKCRKCEAYFIKQINTYIGIASWLRSLLL